MLVLRRREDHDLRLRRGLADARERGEPVHLGHREVEQNEVGTELAGLRGRLFPATGLAHHIEAVLGQETRQRVPREGVVVHDEDALGHELGRLCR